MIPSIGKLARYGAFIFRQGERTLKALEKRVAARLLSSGDLEEKDLEECLKKYDGKRPLHELLVQGGFVSSRAATKAMAEVNGMQFVELAGLPVNPDAVALISAKEAWRWEAIPVWLEKDCLTVAMADPANVMVADEFKLKARGVPVVTLIAEAEDLRFALEKHYGPPPGASSPEVARAMVAETEEHPSRTSNDYFDMATSSDTNVSLHSRDTHLETPLPDPADWQRGSSGTHQQFQRRMRELRRGGGEALHQDINSLETRLEETDPETLRRTEQERARAGAYEDAPETHLEAAEDAPAARILEQIFTTSARQKAQEVELAPLAEGIAVRFRVAGRWVPQQAYPPALHGQVINRLRLMAGLELRSHNTPLEHRFLLKAGPERQLAWLYLLPAAQGERAVIRLVEGLPLLKDPLLDLQLPEEQAQGLNARLLGQGGGLLMVTAADARTLSFLYASIMASLARGGGRDLLSLERPPQPRIPGTNPIVCPSEELLLASLANLAHINPDVLGVSSVENGTVLNRVVDAAMRGTTTVACFTAPSAQVALQCYQAAGIDPMNLHRSLAAHLHVLEAPRLCRQCRRPLQKDQTLPHWMEGADAQEFYQAHGCAQCSGTGYQEGMYLTELFVPDVEAPEGPLRQVTRREELIRSACEAGDLDPRDFEG